MTESFFVAIPAALVPGPPETEAFLDEIRAQLRPIARVIAGDKSEKAHADMEAAAERLERAGILYRQALDGVDLGRDVVEARLPQDITFLRTAAVAGHLFFLRVMSASPAREARLREALVALTKASFDVCERQPAVHSRTQVEADEWGRLYNATNDARAALAASPADGDTRGEREG